MVKADDVIKAGAVVGIIGIGVYAVSKFFAGPSCTTPGSACYSALAPYVQTYQTCANQYAQNMAAYLKEDNANGTGLTSSQLANLQYLQTCMNQAAAQIASVSKTYNQNPLAVLESLGTDIVIGALILIGFKVFKNDIVAAIRGGATAAWNLFKGGVQNALDNGDITATGASAFLTDVSSLGGNTTIAETAFIDSMETLGEITTEDAAVAISETEIAVGDDQATLDALLSAV